MKYLIVVLVLITGLLSGCSGGSSPEETTPERQSLIVIGDSLCAVGWPLLMSDYEVDNQCVGGQGLVGSAWDIIYQHEYKYADRTVIALGANDALVGVDADSFELAYRSLINVVSNPVCLLPPLTDKPYMAILIAEYHNRLITFCPVVLYATPSDAEDGIHYTKEANRINAEIVTQGL